MINYGHSVVEICRMSRQLQKLSASNGNDNELYILVLHIMMECQNLKELIQYNQEENNK